MRSFVLAVAFACCPAVALPAAAQVSVGPTVFAEPVQGPDDPEWRREFAGIRLSTAQIDGVRNLKAVLNAQVGDNGMDFALAARDYANGMRQVLTPRQFARWRRNNATLLRQIEAFDATR